MLGRLKSWIKGAYNYIREEAIPYLKEKLQKEILVCKDCSSTYIIIWNEGVWMENYNKGTIEEYIPDRGEMTCGDCEKSDIYSVMVWRWTKVG